MKQGRKKYILTGGTGFLGSLLAVDLIRDGNNVIFLGRSKKFVPFNERIKNTLQKIDPEVDLSLVQTIEVDFGKTHLGLSGKDIKELNGKIEAIWHLAADLSFHKKDQDRVFATNITGTQNILNLANKIQSKFYFTSTAYVHGNRPGIIYEKELIFPKKFNNYYEESKFMAEKVIHEWGKNNNNKFIIFRPSIIIERKHQTISKFGYYSMVLTFVQLRNNLFLLYKNKPLVAKFLGIRVKNGVIKVPIFFPYNKKNNLNLIPADIVVAWMRKIVNYPNALGQTFHLVNPNPYPVQKVLKYTQEIIGIKLLILAVPKFIARTYFILLNFLGKPFKEIKKLATKVRMYEYYMLEPNEYDMTNTETVLGKKNIENFPQISIKFIKDINKTLLAKHGKNR